MFLQAGHNSTPAMSCTRFKHPNIEVSLQAVCLEVLIMENYGNYLTSDAFLNTRYEFGTQEEYKIWVLFILRLFSTSNKKKLHEGFSPSSFMTLNRFNSKLGTFVSHFYNKKGLTSHLPTGGYMHTQAQRTTTHHFMKPLERYCNTCNVCAP